MLHYPKSETFTNPIISGFYPDPSICRVGDDYYLVNSSFEYFPAIPIWHSKDLVNWQQIGHAIDRPEQGLKIDEVAVSGGVQACTIRHHEGVFYITSTCVGREWPRLDYNFIVTATDPAGPWSDVHYLTDAPGIDSSLFFDEDGTAYFMANRQVSGAEYLADAEIWVQELDLETLTLIGEKHALWQGCGGIYPEGPHLYKRNGYYYLLIAEGGTGHWHTITMARSEHIFGPYIGSPRNPLLSHKHLDMRYPIQNVGHGDLVETQNGEWYLVCLGSRPKGAILDPRVVNYSTGGYSSMLGRETFLVPVTWPDDYSPLISPWTGKVELEYPLPNLPTTKFIPEAACDHFDAPQLSQKWNTIRHPQSTLMSLQDRPGWLRLYCGTDLTTDAATPSFVGQRQTSWHFSATTKIATHLAMNTCAGMTVYHTFAAHFAFQIEETQIGRQLVVKQVAKSTAEQTLATVAVTNSEIWLKIWGEEQTYAFAYSIDGITWQQMDCSLEGYPLASYANDTHTGAYIGLFASGEDQASYADFDYFEYVNN